MMQHVHTKYQGYKPCRFRYEDFFSWFSYINLCKTCDPWNGAIFGPRGITGIVLVEVHQVMLHTKYQIYRSCGFRQEGFFMFDQYKPM